VEYAPPGAAESEYCGIKVPPVVTRNIPLIEVVMARADVLIVPVVTTGKTVV
jgi:hypothetical protein